MTTSNSPSHPSPSAPHNSLVGCQLTIKSLSNMMSSREGISLEHEMRPDMQSLSNRVKTLMELEDEVMQTPEVKEYIEFTNQPKGWQNYGPKEYDRLHRGKEKYFDLLVKNKELFESASKDSPSIHLLNPESGMGEYAIKVFPEAAVALVKNEVISKGAGDYWEYRFTSVSKAKEVIQRSIAEMERNISMAKEAMERLDSKEDVLRTP